MFSLQSSYSTCPSLFMSSNIPALPPIVEDSPSKSKISPVSNGGHFAQRPGKQVTSELNPIHLESRVSALEQANRSLLEELVRLHSELKADSRRRDDVMTAARSDVDRLHHDVAALQGDVKVFSEKLSEDSLHKEEQIAETAAYLKVCTVPAVGGVTGLDVVSTQFLYKGLFTLCNTEIYGLIPATNCIQY